MRLPFAPQSIDTLRARYPAARTSLYDQIAVLNGLQPPPSGMRANVFDFEDGLRLIISRERDPDGLVVMHISASAVDGTPMYQGIHDGRVGVVEFFDRVCTEWQAVSGSARTPTFIGVSPDKLIPHWFVPEEN